jgi:16S rRNA (guanine966-N2)-methyltransferase
MVEQDSNAANQIRRHLQTLKCNSGRVEISDAFHFLAGTATPFDVVFLDPPYRLACLERCCQQLEQGGWLKPRAWIYLEDSSKNPPPQLPDNWQLLRSKKAGDVGYYLALHQAPA